MRRAFEKLDVVRVRVASWRDDRSLAGFGCGCLVCLGAILLCGFLLLIPVLSMMGDGDGRHESAAAIAQREAWIGGWTRNALVAFVTCLAATVWWCLGARPWR